jgi:hypothetical protein
MGLWGPQAWAALVVALWLVLWLVLCRCGCGWCCFFFPIQVLSNDRSYRKKCATPIIQKQTAIHTDTHTHTHIHCASEAWAVQQVGTPLPSSVSQSLSGVRPHNHSITMSLYLLLCGAQARAIMGHERPKPVPIMGTEGPKRVPIMGLWGPKLGPIMGPDHGP